jgi:hypothetical protein
MDMAYLYRAGYAIDPFTKKLTYVGKLPRPAYYCDSAGTVVKVDASEDKPIVVNMGGQLSILDRDLECDLSTNGYGSLDTGSIAANTPYYLYLVPHPVRVVEIVASASDPSTGLDGEDYPRWTYIGACATSSSGASFQEFQATGGKYLCVNEIERETLTGTTTMTQKQFDCLPLTARIGIFQVFLSPNVGDGAGDYVQIGGVNGADTSFIYGQVASISISDGGIETPIITPQNIWLRTSDADNTCQVDLNGWQEDPTEWP